MKIRIAIEQEYDLSDDNIFKITDNNDTSMFGPRHINHQSFQGYQYNYEYLTDSDVDNYYNNRELINPMKFKTINSQGDINPCIKSFFDLYYNS